MKLITSGTTRLVLILGGYALKIARHHRGRRCNRYEAKVWVEATPERKVMLCPVLACRGDGQFLLMRAATPVSDEEIERHRQVGTLPDWDYMPGDEVPFEDKNSDWGELDGKLVVVDYSAPALLIEGEDY